MKDAPKKGATLIDLADRRYGQRPSTRSRPRNQLNEPLERLGALRAALTIWNAAAGVGPMPQPQHFDIDLPDLKPSEIFWQGGWR